LIDLRSDTVTRPTEAMRRAMLEAPVGDDVFGEDPTVNRLEEYVADLLGKEAALYAPSGTMTNQVGVQVNTNRAEEVLLHEGSHIFVYEAGAPAMLSGVQLRTLPGENGVIDPETVRAAVRPEDVHFPRSRLLCLENTHNTSGGKVFPLEDFAAVATTAKELGLKVHLDGARLFNAQAATGVPASEWCAHADTVSVCSSKGLGAPVGSLLAGNEETIEAARRARKAFGGGMRQAGIIASASRAGLRVERGWIRGQGTGDQPRPRRCRRPFRIPAGPRPRRRARHPWQTRLRPLVHTPRCWGKRDRGRHSSSGQDRRQRHRMLRPVEVAPVPATGLASPLALLDEALRDGDSVPEDFADRLRKAVEAGDVEVLAARAEDQMLGVVVLAYRLNVSAGGLFASIEDLQVHPEARCQGVGRALLVAAHERCTKHNISYVEAQVEDAAAETFYASLGYEQETGVRVLSRSLAIGHTRTKS
jgi:threonine aldolase